MATPFNPRSSGTVARQRRVGVPVLLLVLVASLSTGCALIKAAFGKRHFVTVTWTVSQSPGVIGYNVYRGTQIGGQMLKVNRYPLSESQYTDTDVQAGQTYYYEVTAVNQKKLESKRTATVSVTVPSP